MLLTCQARLRLRLTTALAAAAGLALVGAPAGMAQAASVAVACGNAAELINVINMANNADVTSIDLKGCAYALTAPAAPSGPNAHGQNCLPIITGDITINNGTIARCTASGTPLFRILEVAKGGKLTLNRSTITHNTAVDNGTDETLGGGIHSRGTATVTDSVISENSVIESVAQFPGGEIVAEGGGITNTGTLTVKRSQIMNNHAISIGENLGAFGGGLGSFSEPDFRAPAFLTIEDSIISGNTTSGRYTEGAAMEIELDTTITRTQIAGNVSAAQGNVPSPCGFGLSQRNSDSAFADGAILNQGHLILTDSVIQNNRNTILHNPPRTVGTVTLDRTTVTGNSPNNREPTGTIAGRSD